MESKKDKSIVTTLNVILSFVIAILLVIIGIYLIYSKKNKLDKAYLLEEAQARYTMNNKDNCIEDNSEYLYDTKYNTVGKKLKVNDEATNELLENILNHKTVKNGTHSLENVYLNIKEGTLTNTGATLVIQDRNENPYNYSDYYIIEKKNNGNWEKIRESKNEEFSWAVNKEGILELNINWGEPLENGNYRLSKQQYENGQYVYIHTEFEIK